MNRRDFMTVMGGASAASVIGIHPVFAAANTTSLYVKGLVMVSFEDPKVLRLGFPKAPDHKATLSVLPEKGSAHTLNIKKGGSLETAASGVAKPNFVIPELIKMKEIYGSGLRSRIEECPLVISIPYGAVKSIKADELSDTRYTFVRADNGQEVDSFRARQIAESIRIELSSDSVLKLDGGKTSVSLDGTRELRVNYSPDATEHQHGDAFAEHFHYYFAYVDRTGAANFDVVPKKLGGSSSPAPKSGNSFMAYYPYSFCFMVEV